MTALVVALTGVIGLALAPGASADVGIMPPQAEQGGAADVTFRVPDDRGKAYTTKVEVQLPEASPVGEVYPLSVEGWAPTIKYRKLKDSVPGIHRATSTVTTAVTWIRTAKAPKGAWTINEMGLSMGPMPNVAQLPFTVLQTYSDGVVRNWTAPGSTLKSDGAGPVLTLSGAAPAAGGAGAPTAAAQGMQGMEGMPGMGSPQDVPADARTPIGTSEASGSLRFFIITLVGGMVFFALVGGWVVARKRQPMVADAGAEAVNEANKNDNDDEGTSSDENRERSGRPVVKDEQHA